VRTKNWLRRLREPGWGCGQVRRLRLKSQPQAPGLGGEAEPCNVVQLWLLYSGPKVTSVERAQKGAVRGLVRSLT
jgi:hypothetical protein